MNSKTKVWIALNDYVKNAKKYELPSLLYQCQQMEKFILARMGKGNTSKKPKGLLSKVKGIFKHGK